MRKSIIPVVFFLFLSGCTVSEEDTEEFIGVLSTGNMMGYEYTVIKEENHVLSWQIGYKENQLVIQESNSNREYLDNFMNAVNDGELAFAELIIWSVYFLLLIIIALYFYNKNRKILKETSPAFIIFGGISIWLSFNAIMDLINIFKILNKNYYLLLSL